MCPKICREKLISEESKINDYELKIENNKKLIMK